MEGAESAANIASATHVESMDMDKEGHAGTVNAKLQPWQDVITLNRLQDQASKTLSHNVGCCRRTGAPGLHVCGLPA